jgi:hypothetical protein
MGQGRVGGSAWVWVRVGLLAGLLALAAVGTAPAQSAVPSGHGSRTQYDVDEFNRNFERAVKSMQQRDPARAAQWFDRAAVWLIGIALGAVGLVVLWVVAGYVIRPSGTTDPQELAASDPWVQSQMRNSGGETGQPPSPY